MFTTYSHEINLQSSLKSQLNTRIVHAAIWHMQPRLQAPRAAARQTLSFISG